MTDRPARRARTSLLLAGVLVAASVAGVGATSWFLGAGPPLPVTASVTALVALLGAAAGPSARARRASTGALVAASAVAAVAAAVVLGLVALLLVLGRFPRGTEHALLDPLTVAVVAAAALAPPLVRRATTVARAALRAVRRAPDELLADAERAGRGIPVGELLDTLAETVRRDWQLASVEIWTGAGDDARLHRTLVVPRPLGPGAGPAPLTADELATLGRAGVAGTGWLRMWLPRLLVGRDAAAERQLRLAPAVHAGRVLALIVVERPGDAEPFTPADERALADVARRLAVVLRNRALDAALQSTLADLRRTNADLQASRARLVAAADAERRRIERDLHDGAQQHLVALAVGIRLVRDGLADDPPGVDEELLEELDRGVRESISAVRDLAHGIYPPLLRDAGLGDALRAAALRSPLRVDVRAEVGRHPEAVEAAVYFCCLEALQNAAKHAPGAAVTVTLEESRGELCFALADTGPGFDVAHTSPGAGLQNMADRVGAIGGVVEWRAEPGRGTTVSGRVPVAVPAARAR